MMPVASDNRWKKGQLHLLGLSRIPRCASCARFRTLRRAHERRVPPEASLPPVPLACKYPICGPLTSPSPGIALPEDRTED